MNTVYSLIASSIQSHPQCLGDARNKDEWWRAQGGMTWNLLGMAASDVSYVAFGSLIKKNGTFLEDA